MSNPSKNVKLRALIDAAVTDLYPETTLEQLMLDSETTLAAKIAEIVAAVNARAKIVDVDADIAALRNELSNGSTSYTDAKIAALINGAPSTLDTLKEIADAMATNNNVVSALDTAIGTKTNQSDFNTHTANSSIHHTHSNKSVLDATTASFTTAEKAKLASLSTGSPTTLSGLTASVAELNHMDGVTSNVQSQINALWTAINAINAALPYKVTINDSAGTINFADR